MPGSLGAASTRGSLKLSLPSRSSSAAGGGDDGGGGGDEGFVARRRKLAVRLFYRVLERMLVAESSRLQRVEFPALLKNATFQTALLACCMEVVLHSFNLASLQFPRIMHLLDVQPYDLGRVIESFLRAEQSLPTLLKLHMAHVEERLLEQLIWRSGSTVFRLLEGERRHAADGDTPRRRAPHLQVTMRKTMRLAAQRVEGITALLELPDVVVDQVWTTVKEALAEPATLLRDRHLDQVVICGVYAVCKVKHRPMKFLTIIQKYQKMVGPLTRVVRGIRLRSGAVGDIIKLYNEEFLPLMKHHVLRYQATSTPSSATAGSTATTGGGGDGSMPPPPSPGASAASAASAAAAAAEVQIPGVERLPRSKHAASPVRFRGSNIFLSPRHNPAHLRSPAHGRGADGTHMSPGTRAMYAFGESPARVRLLWRVCARVCVCARVRLW